MKNCNCPTCGAPTNVTASEIIPKSNVVELRSAYDGSLMDRNMRSMVNHMVYMLGDHKVINYLEWLIATVKTSRQNRIMRDYGARVDD